MSLKNSLLIVSMTLVSNAFGQTSDSTYFPKSEIKLSYLGAIKYPGLRLGAELPFRLKRVIKTKKNKTINKVQSATFNLSYYHQKDFHNNIYFTTEWQKRRIGAKGFFNEFSCGLGYSRIFLGGTTYKVDNNGNVSIKKFAGYNYAMLILSTGFGYDISIKKKLPLKLFTKLSVITMYPSNSFVFVKPTIELGVVYTPNSFFKTNPSIKIKRK